MKLSARIMREIIYFIGLSTMLPFAGNRVDGKRVDKLIDFLE